MTMIDAKQFEALIEANAIKSVSVNGTAGGFVIQADNKLIEAQRGHTRVFRKLQAAAKFLHARGIGKFHVDVSRWQPDQEASF